MAHKINRSTFIIVGGRPGSGKTTLSEEILRRLDCDSVERDDVFLRLFKKPNPYSVEHKIKAFEECIRLSNNSLKNGKTVILDMPFSRNSEIKKAYNLSRKLSRKWRFVYLKCPESVANERIRKQKKHLVKPELRINTRTEKLPKGIPITKVSSDGLLQTYLKMVLDYISS